MTPRRQRMLLVAAVVAGVAVAVGLGLRAFQENLLYFYSTSAVLKGEAPTDRKFRLGGLVVDGSVERQEGSLEVRFALTDTQSMIPVVYEGILPDLFREGQGIVSHGRLRDDGVFVADEVLAKHDENYMPPEVEDSIRDAHEAGVARKQAAETGYVPEAGEKEPDTDSDDGGDY
ncbi:MAG: cytochrome c maturation protein CcmE [Gammaproteobacteria bacterium]|nr:cytochrome c maturation protein CcmE [Gammaproteobacteria bacterium]